MFLKYLDGLKMVFRLSRLGLKTGVILLGTLYSACRTKKSWRPFCNYDWFFCIRLSRPSFMVRLAKKYSKLYGSVLSAGMGVCGVSATVAAAPVVKAKSVEIAYTIGTSCCGVSYVCLYFQSLDIC